jgi:hypothetical protein
MAEAEPVDALQCLPLVAASVARTWVLLIYLMMATGL